MFSHKKALLFLVSTYPYTFKSAAASNILCGMAAPLSLPPPPPGLRPGLPMRHRPAGWDARDLCGMDRPGPWGVLYNLAPYFCAKVRKWPKKHGKNDNVFHCFSTWAKKERLFALFRKSAKSAKMISEIIDFL